MDARMASAGGVCIAVVVLIVVLVVISFASLEYTEIGLVYSWFGSNINPNAKSAGRYFLGPGYSFIAFPSTLVTVAFAQNGERRPLKSRTSDGLEVDVECSFQYQLSQGTLYDMYSKYGPDYHDIFVSIATETITTEATQYTAALWFSNFTTIQGEIQGELIVAFDGAAFAAIANFQLTSVGLPPPFETEIKTTEVERQNILTAESQRQKTEVQQQTMLVQAGKQAEEITINANADAQAILLNIRGWIEPFTLNQNAQAAAYAEMYPELGNNSEYFLDYLSMRIARDHPTANSVFSHPDL